jgi:AAA ATPase domain
VAPQVVVAVEGVFVGRGAELAAIDVYAEKARAGRAGVVFVEGEAGSGKTALIRRIATANPGRSGDVLERVVVLDSRAGDAAMTGLLDAADRFADEARDVLVELGCQWPSGSVRLRALQLLSVRDGERAAIMAENDVSEVVRRRAGRLQARPVVAPGDSDELEGVGDGYDPPLSNQLALFG